MSKPAQQSAAHLRMVEPWQTHIKFNGREPRNLLERGIAQADYEHRQRLAELKAISKKLEQLDTLLPALVDQGIKIQQRDLRTYDGGKTIWLSAYFGVDDKLHQALLGLGFREIERKETHIGSSKDRVNLKQGRSLVVVLEVSKLPVPQPVATEVAA